jgi:hypothetical protein
MSITLDSRERIRSAIDVCKDNSGDLSEDFIRAMDVIFGENKYEGQDEDQEWFIGFEKEFLFELETEATQRCQSWSEFFVWNVLESQEISCKQ